MTIESRTVPPPASNTTPVVSVAVSRWTTESSSTPPFFRATPMWETSWPAILGHLDLPCHAVGGESFVANVTPGGMRTVRSWMDVPGAADQPQHPLGAPGGNGEDRGSLTLPDHLDRPGW